MVRINIYSYDENSQLHTTTYECEMVIMINSVSILKLMMPDNKDIEIKSKDFAFFGVSNV